MITELLQHFPPNTDPAVVADLVVSFIEQALPEILQEVPLPAKMSGAQRTAEVSRLNGRPGFKQIPKSARPLVQERLDQADKVDALWNVKNQLKQAHKAETSSTVSSPAISRTASGAADNTSRRSPDFTEVFLPIVSSSSIAGISSRSNVRQNTPTLDPGESKTRQTQTSSLLKNVSGTDVRGKFALIQKGRLIDLSDSKLSVYELPSGTQQIEVPVLDLYEELNLNALMAAYGRLPQSKASPSILSRASEAKLIEALISTIELEEQWSALNRRRLYLITKRHTASLRENEHGELDRLQNLAKARVNRIAPLPFSTIEFLHDYAEKAGLAD